MRKQNNLAGGESNSDAKKESQVKRGSSSMSFSLVIVMLGILGLLVGGIIVMPLLDNSQDHMEYYKWTLSVLMGAFGAWIGAGAAYFFGKENLQESSKSTEAAMEIQQKYLQRSFRPEQIKDMTLTAMNSNFIFDLQKTQKDVMDKLKIYRGYWFVPVVDAKTGVLKDVIHSRVFWKEKFDVASAIEDIILDLDRDQDKGKVKDEDGKKLHGDSFYVKVSSNDKLREVYTMLSAREAEVAIVVDEKGKPSHCLTKTEIKTLLNVND